MSILVIGGGWSGLAAAVRLCQQGQPVHLIESAKQLGGRARNVSWQNLEVDNGQHLLIGAYKSTLALLQDLGADETDLFERRSMDISISDSRYAPLKITSDHPLPWPLSLAWRLLRDNDLNTLKQILRLNLHARRFSSEQDMSVETWLGETRQSPRLVSQLWEPLCLAMLNTPITTASASVFAGVLNETFRHKHHTDLLLPRKPLGDTLPRYAASFIHDHGGQISLQSRVKNIRVEQGKVRGVSLSNGQFIAADHIILATPPSVSQQLLPDQLELSAVNSYPISTVYLQYPANYQLPSPVLGLSGVISQWLFDRHDLRPGLISVVISGPGPHEKMDKQHLSAAVAAEIKQFLPAFPASPDDTLVIREKRATFACNVDIHKQRPNNRTEITGLWLAGDFVANPYPATLEGAVLNGEQAARHLIEQLSVGR